MAIELISTVKPKNNGEFPIAEANDIKGGYYSVASIEERDRIPVGRRQPGMLCYVLGDIIYKLNDDLNTWNELKTGGGGGGEAVVESNNIWIGTQPPTEEGYKLWIDISDEVLDETFSSAVINEFKNIISSLTARVIQLEKEVEYLKANGGSGGGGGSEPIEPDDPPISPTTDTIMTFEDGSILTFEDGSIMCFDTTKVVPPTSDTVMAFEDGSIMTFEDGSIMCFDIGEVIPTTNDTLMTFEDGSLLTFEDGSIMCFDIDTSTNIPDTPSTPEDTGTSDIIMIDENLKTLTFENEAIMCFEKTN